MVSQAANELARENRVHARAWILRSCVVALVTLTSVIVANNDIVGTAQRMACFPPSGLWRLIERCAGEESRFFEAAIFGSLMGTTVSIVTRNWTLGQRPWPVFARERDIAVTMVLVGGATLALISVGLLVPPPRVAFTLRITGALLCVLGGTVLVPQRLRAMAAPFALAITLCGLITLWSVFGELPEL
jgi:hypothetical protein